MAKLIDGILGGITSMIGNIEGYQLNGQYIIRSKRQKSSKPPSEKQLATRQAMKLANRFLSVCAPFVKVGYRWIAEPEKAPAYSRAVAQIMKHAIAGHYPYLYIDYSKVQLSSGPLQLLGVNAALQLEGQSLIFNWATGEPGDRATDHVMLLAYCTNLNEAVYEPCGAKRISGAEVLKIPEYWQGKQIETWLSFVEENGDKCMDSIYMGRLSQV